MTMLFAAALALAPAGAPDDVLARLDRIGPGAPAALVAELFPEGPGVRHGDGAVALDDIAVSGDCEADGEIRLAGGAVAAVELRGEGAILGRCGAAVLEALVARLGRPDGVRRRGETPWRRARATYEWRRGGQAVRYVHYTSAGYAGTGLASASWVLTVAGAADGGD